MSWPEEPLIGPLDPAPRNGPQPKLFKEPDLASIRVLSEREAGDRCGVALTVNDATGERYLIIRELNRDLSVPGGWLVGGGERGSGPDTSGQARSMSEHVGLRYGWVLLCWWPGAEHLSRRGPSSSRVGRRVRARG